MPAHTAFGFCCPPLCEGKKVLRCKTEYGGQREGNPILTKESSPVHWPLPPTEENRNPQCHSPHTAKDPGCSCSMKLVFVTSWESPEDWGCKKLEDIWKLEDRKVTPGTETQECTEKGDQEIQTGTSDSDYRRALCAHVWLTQNALSSQSFPEVL